MGRQPLQCKASSAMHLRGLKVKSSGTLTSRIFGSSLARAELQGHQSRAEPVGLHSRVALPIRVGNIAVVLGIFFIPHIGGVRREWCHPRSTAFAFAFERGKGGGGNALGLEINRFPVVWHNRKGDMTRPFQET
ncbi:hypothetical protein BS47DRAFT_1013251 [Hydnum rufescens UP504]|uniref:Uncharacterized protein n=1 Tax=Hydnum rufescens UP504 TaxID=1448309 RepID=A0A9P6AW62_9AGAM|nr:hypothetical protein BS47DRAFT_1013251 [Hydnum rufescens UP504]